MQWMDMNMANYFGFCLDTKKFKREGVFKYILRALRDTTTMTTTTTTTTSTTTTEKKNNNNDKTTLKTMATKTISKTNAATTEVTTMNIYHKVCSCN